MNIGIQFVTNYYTIFVCARHIFFFFLLYFIVFLFLISGRKRTRISHSNSAELAQMAFNHNVPLSDIQVSASESTEISREIKNILNDRCSSGEFRDFVEHIDLESKYRI